MAALDETGARLRPAADGAADPPARDPWWPALRIRLVTGDAALVATAVLLGMLTVDRRVGFGVPSHQAAGFAVAVGLGWLAAIATAGGYQPRYLGAGAEEYRQVCEATFRLFAVVALLGYALHLTLPRSFFAVTAPVGTLLLLLGRWLQRRQVVRARAAGDCVHRVLVVGDEASARELVDRLRTEPAAGFLPVAACLGPGGGPHLGQAPVGVPVLGDPAEAAGLARALAVDVVAVTAGGSVSAVVLRDLAWSLEGSGIDLVVSPTLTDVAGPRIEMRPVAGLPLLYVDEPRLPAGRHLVKTGMDLIGAALGLLLLSPFLLAVALLIRLTSPGPALFRQQRVGRNGELFRVYKFRTMYRDAEARLGELTNEADGLLFKVRDDPRITPLGSWLRKTSIDELPQLGNVLLGQMSLVGPRPLPVRDSDVVGHARRRLLVRPGITGLWQVSGRSDIPWEEAVRLDLHYVENWSVSLDLLILARTVDVVLRRRGAY